MNIRDFDSLKEMVNWVQGPCDEIDFFEYLAKKDQEKLEILLKELESLAGTMDIPILRRRDAGWIMRNVGSKENNRNNPNFEKILAVSKQILKLEIKLNK